MLILLQFIVDDASDLVGFLVDAKQLILHLVLGTLRYGQLADQRRVRLQKALILFFLLVEVLVLTHSGLAAQVLKLTFILFLLLFHV